MTQARPSLPETPTTLEEVADFLAQLLGPRVYVSIVPTLREPVGPEADLACTTKLAVEVQQPPQMPDDEFLRTVSKISPALEDVLPPGCACVWFVAPPG
jgi:hypothetical protein